jgi:hypothetical protein
MHEERRRSADHDQRRQQIPDPPKHPNGLCPKLTREDVRAESGESRNREHVQQ